MISEEVKMCHSMWEKLVIVILVFFANRVSIIASDANGAFPALFAFGDSILDTGNNNNLFTGTKCNFPPYGRDFYGGKPTGRFCDGKVPTDLIAEHFGIKQTVPAYKSGMLQFEDFITGVSFASGGSGNDDLTSNIQGVLSLNVQLQMFEEYIVKLRAAVGQKKATYIISNALYLFSAGNNDIAITYHITLRHTFPFSPYADLLVQSGSNFIKRLYDLGARRVWVLSTLPLGCLPLARTIVGGPLRFCSDFVNQQASLFNFKLASAVKSFRRLPNYDIRFIDVYTPLLQIAQYPWSYGFINGLTGCCGSGTIEIGLLCNAFTLSCPNPSQFVFWDSGHPTQKAYEHIVSKVLRSYEVSNSSHSSP